MADKHRLRTQRTGTVINATSKDQEKEIIQSLLHVEHELKRRFDLFLFHEKQLFLKDVVAELKVHFPDVDFHHHFDRSALKPDGGILFVQTKTGDPLPILITEVKNQGTNDLREQEGLKKQAKGNAIERLGKNVIGFRTAMLKETIFPFVCFGYGCDFESHSSILDRVTTIAMFGKLNTTYLHNQGPQGTFNRGSFYFRPKRWTVEEMTPVMLDVAERSILYYQSKYGTNALRCRPKPISGS